MMYFLSVLHLERGKEEIEIEESVFIEAFIRFHQNVFNREKSQREEKYSASFPHVILHHDNPKRGVGHRVSLHERQPFEGAFSPL